MSPQTTTKPYRLAAGKGLADVWWKTGRLTVKAGRAETGNAFSQIETDDPRGTATPLHVHHNEDESFYVVDGNVTLLVGGERIDLAAGDFAFAPRGIAHAYIVRSDRARMLTTLSPAGLEELFVDCGIPVNGSEPPAAEVLPPIAELARLFGAHGCEVLGPPPTLDGLDNNREHPIVHQSPGDADRRLDFHPVMGMRWEITRGTEETSGELFEFTNSLDARLPGPPTRASSSGSRRRTPAPPSTQRCCTTDTRKKFARPGLKGLFKALALVGKALRFDL